MGTNWGFVAAYGGVHATLLFLLIGLAAPAEVRINGPDASVRFDNETGEEVARLTASEGWINTSALLEVHDVVVSVTGDSLLAMAAELREAKAQLAELRLTLSTLAPNLPPSAPLPQAPPPPPDYVVFNGGVHSNLDVSVAGEVSRPGTGLGEGRWGSSAYTTSPNVITTDSVRRGISFKCYPGVVFNGGPFNGGHAMVTIRNPEPSSPSAITESNPATASTYGIFCRPNGQADHMVGTCRYGSCTTLARTTSNPYTSGDVFTVRVPSAGTVEWLVNGVVTNTVTDQVIDYPLHVNVEIHGSTVYDIIWV